jgi:hypothetical protein
VVAVLRLFQRGARGSAQMFDGACSPIVNQRVGIRAQNGSCGMVEVSRYIVVWFWWSLWVEVSEWVVVGVVEDG